MENRSCMVSSDSAGLLSVSPARLLGRASASERYNNTILFKKSVISKEGLLHKYLTFCVPVSRACKTLHRYVPTSCMYVYVVFR